MQNVEAVILGENMQPEGKYKIKDGVSSFDHHPLIDFEHFYSQGHPISRNPPKQSGKQEGISGIHIRSDSTPLSAYYPVKP